MRVIVHSDTLYNLYTHFPNFTTNNYLQIVGTSGFFAKNYLKEIVGVTGSSNLVVKAQLMRIGITKFIAIAPPGYDNYCKFYYSHYFKETIIMY